MALAWKLDEEMDKLIDGTFGEAEKAGIYAEGSKSLRGMLASFRFF